MERSYFYYNVLDSTMLEYQRLREYNNGTICVRTDYQGDGVGRDNHNWLSPTGGLWFTFDIVFSGFVSSFGLYTGYCLHRELCRLFYPLADKLQIKWTNDIIYDGKKLGGVLCKSHPGRYTIGIGLNTNNDIDSSLGKFGAVSLKNILNTNISNEQLCFSLIDAVERNVRLLSHEITYITYCNENLFGKNCKALIDVGTEPFEAEILGIDLKGALIVRKGMGEIINLSSGSILSIEAFS
ncbi:MAG: biotin--[acetyl-CoA-carboxylase] ligase [Candidatus Cloacimonetes bacterium]|nr:biotin--[acetyl-CoA-carboxylase] ligase [Candidatus Cloacimonadota bacterium]MDY0298842.1 biotin--[acetyl-CoA-carboxylase] ligase [Candidatus Cloacimonadaceae bacterium]MCB5279138.1 biotin--[acetyl-CoA-carboxylase] ligase [Candidatus Cloacimonadota bacterium]MCK9333441.1 biotin--[acetyl-CoA-carboxylase] ligase [Candidatus Cloacimonadota bacterium]MDD2211321.1 biotin--[acetyl-CoA-carboxylase] ligase [Candidatus Cloacimonadota bacterium]